MNHILPHGAAYPLSIGGELAVEQKALHTRLQAWNVHHLHKVALHYGQLLWVHHTPVLRMLPLQEAVFSKEGLFELWTSLKDVVKLLNSGLSRKKVGLHDLER